MQHGMNIENVLSVGCPKCAMVTVSLPQLVRAASGMLPSHPLSISCRFDLVTTTFTSGAEVCIVKSPFYAVVAKCLYCLCIIIHPSCLPACLPACHQVTVDDHPHLPWKFASIHPCRHAAVMKKIMGMMADNGKEPRVDQ